MKILMVTNFLNEEVLEDVWIASSFKEDGHEVCLVMMDYNEQLDAIYDVIIRRNTWYADETKLNLYYDQTKEWNQRVLNKKLYAINFGGKFDQRGKSYLYDLYQKGYPVVPTWISPKEVEHTEYEKYLLKPIKGYDGVGQIKGSKPEMVHYHNENYMIQPYLKFQSEVQFYFVGTKLCYALEFSPSKIPIYPVPTTYFYNQEEQKLAQTFADLNEGFLGVQRIDFMKLHTGELLLLEIEDSAPYLDLEYVEEPIRKEFLKIYKKMVYNSIKKR